MISCGRRIGLLAVLALALAGRTGGAAAYARDGGPVDFGAAEIEAATAGGGTQSRGAGLAALRRDGRHTVSESAVDEPRGARGLAQDFLQVCSNDLTIVGATTAVPAIAATPGGTVLEAEDAVAASCLGGLDAASRAVPL